MDADARRLKKIREAERLRDVPPEVTLEAGFQLMLFGAELRAGARVSLARR